MDEGLVWLLFVIFIGVLLLVIIGSVKRRQEEERQRQVRIQQIQRDRQRMEQEYQEIIDQTAQSDEERRKRLYSITGIDHEEYVQQVEERQKAFEEQNRQWIRRELGYIPLDEHGNVDHGKVLELLDQKRRDELDRTYRTLTSIPGMSNSMWTLLPRCMKIMGILLSRGIAKRLGLIWLYAKGRGG